MTASALSEVLAVFQKNGPVLKASELKIHGIGSRDLALLQKEGLVRKIKTGYYIWAGSGEPDRLEPVSYTHLDVYKRQVSGFVRREVP